MNVRVETKYEELTLVVTIVTTRPSKIRLKVYDFNNPKTVFLNRYNTIRGKEDLYVRLPISSNQVLVEIYNQDNGNQRKGQDSSFKVLDIVKIPLQKRTDVSDIKKIEVASFVDFAQRFSFNSSYLKPDVYQSQDGKFLIEYLPNIVSNRNGKVLKTPARISKQTGKIQVSKEKFDQYTVPMRMAILLHEFSHFFLNKNMDDETEADLNGLLIYLGLGFPRIEAFKAFHEVFVEVPSGQNGNRFKIIDKFIKDFENKKIVLE